MQLSNEGWVTYTLPHFQTSRLPASTLTQPHLHYVKTMLLSYTLSQLHSKEEKLIRRKPLRVTRIKEEETLYGAATSSEWRGYSPSGEGKDVAVCFPWWCHLLLVLPHFIVTFIFKWHHGETTNKSVECSKWIAGDPSGVLFPSDVISLINGIFTPDYAELTNNNRCSNLRGEGSMTCGNLGISWWRRLVKLTLPW